MPRLQKLDNKGLPTGEPIYYKDSIARKLVSFKKSKWKLVDGDKPKVSRQNPVPVSTDFPKTAQEQLEWIKKQESINKLKGAIHLATQSKIVADSLLKRIEVLNNKPI